MQCNNELILLESDEVKGKYLCTKDNSIIEAIGTVAVPGNKKATQRYRATVIWAWDDNASIASQALTAKKICGKYLSNVSNKDLLYMAQKKINWTFGEFLYGDAIDILELSKKYKLIIEMVDIENQEKLII